MTLNAELEALGLLALAIAPCVALAAFIHFKDKLDREPWYMLVISFALGAFSSAPVLMLEYGVQQNQWFSTTLGSAFLGIALIEEGLKYLVLRWYAYPKSVFDEPYDGITYAVMVSMGFATFENIAYALRFGTETTLLRMFTAVPAHATFAVLMGFYMGLAKFSRVPIVYLISALVAPVLLHGFYNYFLMVKWFEGVYWGAFISLALGVGFSWRAIRIHQKTTFK